MAEIFVVILYVLLALIFAFAWHAVKVCNTLLPAIPPKSPMWIEGLTLLKYGFIWIMIFTAAALVTLGKVLP